MVVSREQGNISVELVGFSPASHSCISVSKKELLYRLKSYSRIMSYCGSTLRMSELRRCNHRWNIGSHGL